MIRREAKLNIEWVHTDRATVYSNIDKIYDDFEAQLKAKDKKIAELEEAMKPKTCDGCAFNFLSPTDIGLLRQSQCFLCVRNTEEVKDHYEPKDNE